MIPNLEEIRQDTEVTYNKLLSETVKSLCSGWGIAINTAGKINGQSKITFDPAKDTNLFSVSWSISCDAVYLAVMEFVKAGYKVELHYCNKSSKMADKITISWDKDIPKNNLIVTYERK